MRHYDTAMRRYTSKRVEEIESADILVGIPCYNNERTIVHIIQMVTHGLAKNYKDRRCVIFIADGGSTDDTREMAKEFQIKPWQEKIVSIYRGTEGKGTALRSIFEAADLLNVMACAVVDSDLRSITSDWIKYLLDPVLSKDYQFVAPVYLRHKYDGAITNNIVYNLTRSLYGKRIRQPIGGDFAISREVAKFYIKQDVWDTDVARYGSDIWMTTNAIIQNYRICQSNLGVKTRYAKESDLQLGPIFRQIMWTLYSLMEQFERYWKGIHGSEPVKTFGYKGYVEPEPFSVDLEKMVQHFKNGFNQFSAFYKEIFCDDCFDEIRMIAGMETNRFYLSTEAWVRMLYELAATFHGWSVNRNKLIDLMTPLYYARVASFVRQSRKMSSQEAEELVEEQAIKFEEQKEYLIKLWDQKFSKKDKIEFRA